MATITGLGQWGTAPILLTEGRTEQFSGSRAPNGFGLAAHRSWLCPHKTPEPCLMSIAHGQRQGEAWMSAVRRTALKIA